MAAIPKLEARYGKQTVPVFKIRKEGPTHRIHDMMVQVMLEGEVAASWLSGENHQILPTETQKNTCYALALKTEFDCAETYALALARDILARHEHISNITVDLEERQWETVMIKGKPHVHVFHSARDPAKRTCHVFLERGKEHSPVVISGMKDIKLMKTAQSGFQGYIIDQYTDLQPVGAGSDTPERIMCTELQAEWGFSRAPAAGFASTNTDVFATLLEIFSGPADTGVWSKSVQQTAYNMCTEVLRRFPEVSHVRLVTPNIHHYLYPLQRFGMRNPNVVFQSTDCHTSASGRIETVVRRPAAKL